jgi:hypothetical protein
VRIFLPGSAEVAGAAEPPAGTRPFCRWGVAVEGVGGRIATVRGASWLSGAVMERDCDSGGPSRVGRAQRLPSTECGSGCILAECVGCRRCFAASLLHAESWLRAWVFVQEGELGWRRSNAASDTTRIANV